MRSRVTCAVVSISSETRLMLRHRMTTDVGLLAASQYLSAGLDFLMAAVVARLLGPSEYGVATLVIAYPTLLWSFVGTKSVSVTTRYIASFRATGRFEELAGICKFGYSLDVIAATTAFVLVGATGWWVAPHIFNLPSMAWLMVAYGAAFPFFALTGTSWAILSAWRRFRCFATLQVLYHGITFVVVLGFLVAGFGVPGMIVGMAIGRAVMGLAIMTVATCMLHREGLGFWWNASCKKITSLRQEFTAFLGWNYFAVTLSGLTAEVPLLLLGRFRGPEEAGFYRLATSLMTGASLVESALGKVAYPILSARWAAGERKSLSRTLKRWTLRGGLPICAVVLLSIPLLPIVVPVVFGPGYRPMLPGAQMMIIGAAVSVAFFWLNSFYYASGRIGQWTKAYGLYTALVILLAWLSIQQWGFSGMGILVGVGKMLFTLSMVGALVSTHERMQ
jgi:O-antigen/teichoic acid export membrane protein